MSSVGDVQNPVTQASKLTFHALCCSTRVMTPTATRTEEDSYRRS